MDINYAGFSSELKTLIAASLPVSELRVALPLAYFKYKLPIHEAFFWSVVGNIIPAAVLLCIFRPTADWFREKVNLIKRITDWWFIKVKEKHRKKIEKWGALALISIVAIPLPGTGAWTGVLVSYLFGIKYSKAFLCISLGVIIAGLIVSLISLGVFKLI